MAKEKKLPSFSDFTAENLLDTEIPSAVAATETEDELEEVGEVEGKEEESGKEKEKVKQPKVTSKKKVEKVEEVEETEEEEKEVEGKKPEVKAKTETEEVEEEVDPVDAEMFFAKVEKLTGQEINVEYGETDPLSPEGVALRESAVRELALDNFLEEMEEKFPIVFKALKHASNGGDVAELFTQAVTRDYSKVMIKDEDTAMAKEILKDYYKSKGVKSEARITKLIEADEDSETGLVKEAQAALEELKAEQTEKSNTLLETQEKKAAEDRKRDQILVTALDETIDSRDLGGFKIADKSEASQFRSYVLQNIRKTGDGKYELSTPLDSANLAKALQYQYFQFKQGDLSKIIRQKADSEVAKKLSLRLKGEQDKFKKTAIAEDTSKQGRTLKSYEV